MSGTYNVWKLMKRRCNSPKSPSWKDYGGRGIRVCDRWADFLLFVADLGEVPPGMTLERKDVNGNYEPENCTWIPKAEQRKNTRHTHILTYNGVTQPLSYWAADVGISSAAMKYRISRYGMEKAMTTPVDPKKVKAGTTSQEVQGKDALIKRSIQERQTKPRKTITSLENYWHNHKRKPKS